MIVYSTGIQIVLCFSRVYMHLMPLDGSFIVLRTHLDLAGFAGHSFVDMYRNITVDTLLKPDVILAIYRILL